MPISLSSLYDNNFIQVIPPETRINPRCAHNRHIECRWSPCPLTDHKFTRNLDRYCERYGSRPSVDCSVIHGPRDHSRATVPNLYLLETALWFDHRDTLERYAAWKDSAASLRVTRAFCADIRRAYCRWLAREQPPGVRRPTWMRGWSQWRRVCYVVET